MSWTRRCLLIAVVGVGGLAPSAQAATWTEIPSNTAEDITAIEYQGPERFWFATGAGKIFRRVGGGFAQKASFPGAVFKDIEFQDGGQVGFAVGTNGTVARSPDGGDSWAAVPGIAGGHPTTVNDCTSAGQAIGDVDSVRFAGNARAWLVAGGSQIYRTVDGATAANIGSAALGWVPINNGDAGCRITKDIDDLFPVPGSDSVYFISKSFGAVFFSSNALTSAAAQKPADAGNGFTGIRRVAGDPGNPNRQWAVTSADAGASFYSRTTDGWSTSSAWVVANPGRGSLTRAEGVDFSGGTVTAVGSAGMIVESIDGNTFYFDPAGGTVATQDWRSVSLASAKDAAVGGTGGKLIVSANANVIPGTAGGAGNVSPPPAPPPPLLKPRKPTFTFAPKSKPPVIGGAARKRGRFVRIDVSGSLKRPAGVASAAACKGKVALTVSTPKGKKRTLTSATATLSKKCRYKKLLRVRRSRIGTLRSLKLKVAFKGNPAVAASSVTYTVRVK